jgi:hypothetical protein
MHKCLASESEAMLAVRSGPVEWPVGARAGTPTFSVPKFSRNYAGAERVVSAIVAPWSGGRAVSYLRFRTLLHDHKKRLVGPPETVRAAHRAQSQHGQNVFFDEVAGM